jgi:predicted secreted protein with PEFG-CTERM motif
MKSLFHYLQVSFIPQNIHKAADLGIGFKNTNGNFVMHQNYAIIVTQDNNTVLSNSAGHTNTGIDTQITSVLSSANPLGITVTLNGVGLSGTDPSTWTGPKGEVLRFGQVAPDSSAGSINATSNSANNTVPEFGSIASAILGIAIISIIAISARTKLGFN